MLKAKSADTARISFRGSIYRIFDAYPTKAGANSAVRGLRTKQGRVDRDYYTNAIWQ